MGTTVPDSGTWSSSVESPDAVGGKIFVTERMVARMGDLSLRDRHLGERYKGTNLPYLNQKLTPESVASEAFHALQDGTGSVAMGTAFTKQDPDSTSLSQTGCSAFTLSNNNGDPATSERYRRFADSTEKRNVNYDSGDNSKNINSRDRNTLKRMSVEDNNDDDEEVEEANDDVELKNNRTPEASLLICNAVKTAICANSTMEQRLAIEMMKKSTMAVVLWSPRKAQLAQSTAPMLPMGPRSNLCNGISEMDEQESASVSSDGRVRLLDDIARLSGSVGPVNEDIMEVM
ncbi:hypothetical protein BIW11_03888 [Tropilaelaps mercedesae]|uniref:Uncharacterized protein n=1 Tax=Tropilaelaps mercedesae TaxID=418985 RepID=A0A1V9XEA9_9ACAR|nr:hypothetical protein BIW11_03888 [Tropilaelaps mercedesae]